MDDENRDNRYDSIEYDDDWQTATTVTPDFEDYTDAEYGDKAFIGNKSFEQVMERKKRKKSGQGLIKFQLFLCLIIGLFSFALKNMGGNIYTAAKAWYSEQISASLIITVDNDNGH